MRCFKHFNIRGITAVIAAVSVLAAGILTRYVTAAVPNAHWVSSSSSVATTKEKIHSVFPESYWVSLDALIDAHPNWTFQAFYTGLNWNECFDGSYTKWDPNGESEMTLQRNLLESNYWPSSWYSTTHNGAFNWASNSWTVYSAPNWIQASEEAIRYCMDPRNFLTSDQIFQFEDQTYYEASVTEVEAVFKKTTGGNWTKTADQTGIYSDYSGKNMTYAQAVYEIGKRIGMNPVILASRIIQEQGEGNSPLISGTKTFTVTSGPDTGKVVNGGYYNYFNMEATDGGSTANYELIYNNGLTEAYKAGWNSRYKALYGGAQKFKANFVANDQNTYYFQKFCVKSDSRYCFWHQYMQSLTTPQHESSKTYNGYKNSGTLDVRHRFIIPVFMNMPAKPEAKPTRTGNPNYKLASIYVDGSALSGFATDKLTYSMSVAPDTSKVRLNIKAYAATTTIQIDDQSAKGTFAGDVNVMIGDNAIHVKSIAEDGTVRTYTINVHRSGEVVCGDINGDGKYNSLDLAYMTSHVLGKNTLTGSALDAADISGDGKINSLDLAYLTSYLLGKLQTLPR